MSTRRTAKITQAEIDRIFKAAEKTGLDARIELPDGTIISTAKATTAETDVMNNGGNPWDEVLQNAADKKRAS
jgi:hypothetical protein